MISVLRLTLYALIASAVAWAIGYTLAAVASSAFELILFPLITFYMASAS